MTWRPWGWRDAVLSDIQADAAATRLAVNNIIRKINQLGTEIHTMAAREDAAYEALTATIQTVKDGWASLVAENATLKAALANADAATQAAVQAALDADSDVDASKVEAARDALAELVPAAPEQPAEPEVPAEPEAPVEPGPDAA